MSKKKEHKGNGKVVPSAVKCRMCNGSGTVPIHGTRDERVCPNCHGAGEI